MLEVLPRVVGQPYEGQPTIGRSFGEPDHDASGDVDESVNLGSLDVALRESRPNSAVVKVVLITANVFEDHLSITG